MTMQNWAVEWLNLNANRKYPLLDTVTATDTTGAFTLPDDFLVELDLPVNAGTVFEPSRLYLRTLVLHSMGATVSIGYDSQDIALAVIPFDNFVQNQTFGLLGVGNHADIIGKVVIGGIVNLQQYPPGRYTFTEQTAQLEPGCVRPMLRGVSAIYVETEGTLSAPIYGDVVLVAQENMKIVPVLVPDEPTQLRFSAIAGEGLAEACVCTDTVNSGPPILRINGVGPGPDGNVNLLGSQCLQLEGFTYGLKLLNPCSTPCCGCPELEKIARDQEGFGSTLVTIQNTQIRLEGSVTQMDKVVLSSRLNDAGCATCGS